MIIRRKYRMIPGLKLTRFALLFSLLVLACSPLTDTELRIITAAGLSQSAGAYIKRFTQGEIGKLPENSGRQGITVKVAFGKTGETRQILNRYLRTKGWLVFLIKQNYDQDGQENVLGIIHTRDPYDILRIQQTRIRKRSTEEIIARLQAWQARFGLEVSGAESYWVTAEFTAPLQPPDWQQFAEELAAFCPELLNDGTGRIEDLAANMQKNGAFTLYY